MATIHPNLEPAHLKGLRVWSCNGMRVLTIKGNTKTTITAGINARTKPALSLTLGGSAISKEHLAQIKSGVEQGISDAKSKAHGRFDEHRLQQQLRAQPHRLRLEHPLLREVPAWRPIGGENGPLGRGFIDLAGLDSVGDLVIVETKLGADAMLVLQGLDYWIWALADENREWLIKRLHGDPNHAKTHLLYAIASKGNAAPVVDRYCRAHLTVLDPSIAWRLALITNWDDPNSIDVQMLPPRAQSD